MRLGEPTTALVPQPVLANIRGRLVRKRAIDDVDTAVGSVYNAGIRELS